MIRVLGIGFRTVIEPQSLLRFAQTFGPVDLLATSAQKAGEEITQELARALGVGLVAVAPHAIRAQPTPSVSPRIMARFGTGSLAEAAALVAAGPRAGLLQFRQVSPCGRATGAVAEGQGVDG